MSGCDSYSIFGDQEKRNGTNAPGTSTSRFELNPLDVRGRRLLHANYQVPEPLSQTNDARHETLVSETSETAENQEKGNSKHAVATFRALESEIMAATVLILSHVTTEERKPR